MNALVHLGAVAAAAAVNLVATVALCRSGRQRMLGAMAWGAAIGFAALAALGATVSLPLADRLVDVLTYACACYVFVHFNNMGETARRVRLVRELAAAPSGLTEPELVARYGAREMIDRRLERLVDSRQIRRDGGRLTIANPSVLWMARLIGLAKRVVLGERRERAWPRASAR